jgi:hypothetical protein
VSVALMMAPLNAGIDCTAVNRNIATATPQIVRLRAMADDLRRPAARTLELAWLISYAAAVARGATTRPFPGAGCRAPPAAHRVTISRVLPNSWVEPHQQVHDGGGGVRIEIAPVGRRPR